MPVTFFERRGWTVFAGLSLILIMFGAGDVIEGGATYNGGEVVLFKSMTGTTWDALRSADPGAAKLIESQVRGTGALLLVFGLLSLLVSVNALRRGQRWAWWAMWTWPLWFVLNYVLLWIAQPDLRAGLPVPLISGTVFLVITVATLGLSFRRYRRSVEPATSLPTSG